MKFNKRHRQGSSMAADIMKIGLTDITHLMCPALYPFP